MKTPIVPNNKGIVLVIAILMLAAITFLGFIAINVSNVGTKITSNTRTSKQAFSLSEAGIEIARELLRIRKAGGSTLSGELDLVKGPNGILTDSTDVANFSSADDIPFINITPLANGNFKVYLTNDGVDGITSTSDTNGIVILTSFGYGPDKSQAIIQVTVQQAVIPRLSGAITMPGPHVAFNGGSSNVSTYSGDSTHPAIAVNSAAGQTEVINGIPANRQENFIGGGIDSPSVQNMVFPDPWGNLPQLQNLYNSLKNIANFTSSAATGFTLGTSADPKVVVIDGDYTIAGGTSGAGVLLVTGNLTLSGNISYDGVLLAVGRGTITREGGGVGVISGGIYLANIAGPDGNINTTGDNTWGTPSWNTSGGGTSDIDYVYASESNALQLLPFTNISWKQCGR